MSSKLKWVKDTAVDYLILLTHIIFNRKELYDLLIELGILPKFRS